MIIQAWPSKTAGERRQTMLDLGYYLLERSQKPMDRVELAREMRAFAEQQGVAVNRSQWGRWAAAAINHHADHQRAINPRVVESIRYKASVRHERLAAKLEAAVHRLLPDDVLHGDGARLDGLADDVKAATGAARAIVDIDRLRADMMQWSKRPADEAVQSEDASIEALALIRRYLTDATPEVRAQVLQHAQDSLDEQPSDTSDVLAELGLH